MRLVTILINERCPLRCKHCSVGFSEAYHGTAFRIDADELVRTIRSIDRRVYKLVMFGGGEPSLDPALLRIGIKACQEAGLLCGMVTAPVWAPAGDKAKTFLDKIEGMTDMVLSYDTFHLEFLKFAHYEHAIAEAASRGIRVGINITYASEADKQNLLDSLAPVRPAISYIGTYRAVPIGNASDVANVNVEYVTLETIEDLDALPRGCVLGHAYVDKNSKVHGCCYSCVGEHSPFSGPAGITPKEAFHILENRPVFQAVMKSGFLGALSPEGKRALVGQMHGRRFATECDLCIAAMKPEMDAIWSECVLKEEFPVEAPAQSAF